MPQTIEERHPDTESARSQRDILDRESWTSLLEAIESQECTPILGSAVYTKSPLPRRTVIAEQWAREYDYPYGPPYELSQIAQFLAVRYSPPFPRRKLVKILESIPVPDFNEPDAPYKVWADLPLPVYITTAYHNFLSKALASHEMRKPVQEFYRWNEDLRREKSLFDSDYRPDPGHPVVYHLFGHIGQPDSLVLTEHDYLDFLVNIARDPETIPHPIDKAFGKSYLLFLGYRLFDLDFLVLLRGLAGYLKRNPYSQGKSHISVHLVDVNSPQEKTRAEEYLKSYLDMHSIRVCLGPCEDFLAELRRRWEEA